MITNKIKILFLKFIIKHYKKNLEKGNIIEISDYEKFNDDLRDKYSNAYEEFYNSKEYEDLYNDELKKIC